MNQFAWALAAFVLIHVGISATGLRTALVSRIGEGPYRAVFALVSLALLLWLIQGFDQMRHINLEDPLNEVLWAPPPGLREWLDGLAMLIAGIGVTFIVAGLFAPGPTLAGYEKRGLARPEPAYGMLRITRHPFLWGVALWAAGHLLANGEAFALMLFGALGLMVLLGSRSIDRKGRARDPEGYARFEAVSSNVPFAAVIQGRNRLVLAEIALPVLVGVAAALLAAWAHETVSGGTPLF